jgi:signal peptidase complex subunit 2
MAPSSSSTATPIVVDAVETPATEIHQASEELLQIELGDMVKLKQVLDEAVAQAIVEPAHHMIQEDTKWDNFKLLLMTLACVFAMIGQFAPIPFPESRPILGVCCCLYFLLSGILQFITTYIDCDSILATLPPKSKTGKPCSNADLAQSGVCVRSQLPRFSEWYTVSLEVRDKPKLKVEQTWSVGRFFDKDGYFDEIGLNQEIDKLYQRLVDGKYSKPATTTASVATKKKN